MTHSTQRIFLTNFFTVHNPKVLDKIDSMLELNLSDKELVEFLEKKYSTRIKMEEYLNSNVLSDGATFQGFDVQTKVHDEMVTTFIEPLKSTTLENKQVLSEEYPTSNQDPTIKKEQVDYLSYTLDTLGKRMDEMDSYAHKIKDAGGAAKAIYDWIRVYLIVLVGYQFILQWNWNAAGDNIDALQKANEFAQTCNTVFSVIQFIILSVILSFLKSFSCSLKNADKKIVAPETTAEKSEAMGILGVSLLFLLILIIIWFYNH